MPLYGEVILYPEVSFLVALIKEINSCLSFIHLEEYWALIFKVLKK